MIDQAPSDRLKAPNRAWPNPQGIPQTQKHSQPKRGTTWGKNKKTKKKEWSSLLNNQR